MRAALYARFSTDAQNPASIADQLAAARRYAQALGAEVVADFSDAAISGQAMANRPGLRALLDLARAGGCDLVVTEHTDRLSRSGGDSWAIYDDLKALGVRIVTVNQGEIGTLHVGMSGTMSALMIEEISRKTRRGMRGVVEAGRSAGGLTYGYRKALQYDGRGEPIRGLLEIHPDQAPVVIRVFEAYARGASPQAIAAALNADAIPGPRGGPWNASTIHGNAKRGNGLLHNELYNGVRVWGRHAYVKDRHTGERRGRFVGGGNVVPGPGGASQVPGQEVVRTLVPDLRIVPQPLWDEVRAAYARISQGARGGRPEGARRPKRFLSGLVVCGLCGGRMNITGAGGAMRCHTRVERGPLACANTRAPAYTGIEARVLSAIQANLLHPEVIAVAVREFQHAARERQRQGARGRHALERELAETGRRIERLVDMMEEGTPWSAIKARHDTHTARQAEIRDQLADLATADSVVELHPSAANLYRDLVADLQAVIAGGDTTSAEPREALRRLVQEVRLTPLPAHGQYALDLVGDLAPLLQLGQRTNEKGPLAGAEIMGITPTVGAGTRIARQPTFAAPVRIRA